MDNKNKFKHFNGLTLAYVGDAVYELHVRKYLIEMGQENPNELHQRAVSFVTAMAQADVVWHWQEDELLTEEEERIIRRGRNAKSRSVPKNTSIQAYRYSTAFEALIGYHYLLENDERLHELLTSAIQIVTERSREDG